MLCPRECAQCMQAYSHVVVASEGVLNYERLDTKMNLLNEIILLYTQPAIYCSNPAL